VGVTGATEPKQRAALTEAAAGGVLPQPARRVGLVAPCAVGISRAVAGAIRILAPILQTDREICRQTEQG